MPLVSILGFNIPMPNFELIDYWPDLTAIAQRRYGEVEITDAATVVWGGLVETDSELR